MLVKPPFVEYPTDQCSRRHPDVFSSCAVTRAMVKRGLDSDLVCLEDTFLTRPDVAGSSSSQSPVGELETTTANFDDSTRGGDNSEKIESVKVVPPLGVINGESAVTVLSSSELERCSLPDLSRFHVKI